MIRVGKYVLRTFADLEPDVQEKVIRHAFFDCIQSGLYNDKYFTISPIEIEDGNVSATVTWHKDGIAKEMSDWLYAKDGAVLAELDRHNLSVEEVEDYIGSAKFVDGLTDEEIESLIYKPELDDSADGALPEMETA